MRFRFLTYNIHKGIGGIDRRYRPERIIETIAHYDPHIVFLQEADDGVPRSRRDRQVDLLGDALGMRYRAFQRNVHLRQGHYGNAILSKFPLDDVCNINLTVPLKKRRQALAARCHLKVDGHSHSLLLFNFHLGLADYERITQLRRFLEHHMIAKSHRTTAVIAAGDFNDVWGNLGRRMLEPAGFHSAAGPLKTFPAYLPLRPLDRIFYRGTIEPDHCFRSHTQLSRYASDHLPMIAEFIIE